MDERVIADSGAVGEMMRVLCDRKRCLGTECTTLRTTWRWRRGSRGARRSEGEVVTCRAAAALSVISWRAPSSSLERVVETTWTIS